MSEIEKLHKKHKIKNYPFDKPFSKLYSDKTGKYSNISSCSLKIKIRNINIEHKSINYFDFYKLFNEKEMTVKEVFIENNKFNAPIFDHYQLSNNNFINLIQYPIKDLIFKLNHQEIKDAYQIIRNQCKTKEISNKLISIILRLNIPYFEEARFYYKPEKQFSIYQSEEMLNRFYEKGWNKDIEDLIIIERYGNRKNYIKRKKERKGSSKFLTPVMFNKSKTILDYDKVVL
jgi:hypothetical protein